MLKDFDFVHVLARLVDHGHRGTGPSKFSRLVDLDTFVLVLTYFFLENLVLHLVVQLVLSHI